MEDKNFKKILRIEIGKNTNIKYEWVPGTNNFIVDRVLYGAYRYPQNYGFFEKTMDWDGDPLDGIVLSSETFMTGSYVEVRIIGQMRMIDSGEIDTKLITVMCNDPRFDHIQSLKDVPEHTLKEIKDFFENYKNLQNKIVKIEGFDGSREAIETFKECEEFYSEHSEKSKKEFLSYMKEKFPNKYN